MHSQEIYLAYFNMNGDYIGDYTYSSQSFGRRDITNEVILLRNFRLLRCLLVPLEDYDTITIGVTECSTGNKFLILPKSPLTITKSESKYKVKKYHNLDEFDKIDWDVIELNELDYTWSIDWGCCGYSFNFGLPGINIKCQDEQEIGRAS